MANQVPAMKRVVDLNDVLTLATPRAGAPLKGVAILVSNTPHLNQSQPSVINRIHAAKVSDLPLRNDQGSYDHQTPPDLSSSAAIGNYIHTRTAAWTQHLHRLRRRHEAYASSNENGPRKGTKK